MIVSVLLLVTVVVAGVFVERETDKPSFILEGLSREIYRELSEDNQANVNDPVLMNKLELEGEESEDTA
jgi:hypothetical protein